MYDSCTQSFRLSPLCCDTQNCIVVVVDLLAGRKTVGTIEGNIAFAGVKPTTEFLRRFTGYVEQFGARIYSKL